MFAKRYYCVFLVFLNAILLFFLRRTYVEHQHMTHASRASQNCLSSSNTPATSASQSVIRTNEESQYAMYGQGNLAYDNEQLLNYIRSMMSRQGPGGRHLSSDSSKIDFSGMGESTFVDKLLKQRRNGFYIECGAFSGEDLSDTLFFEIQRNWTGLLIEPHPEYHRSILSKNRNALVLRACLSHGAHPMFTRFRLHGWGSGVSALNINVKQDDKSIPETDVQCFSLNSVMAAIGVRHIDLLVLDVEGSEVPILNNIDWTRLSVDVFIIEYKHDQNKLQEIRQVFNKTGIVYEVVATVPVGLAIDKANDVVFMRV